MRWLVLALSILLVGTAYAADDGRTTHITYLVGNSVYIDAGLEMGLTDGVRVEVIRDGKTVAVLEVQDLSSRRASCSIVSAEVGLVVGDSVRLPESAAPAIVPVEGAVVASQSIDRAASRHRTWGSALGITGRVGARYLTVIDRSGLGEDFSQPSLDLNILGTRVSGSDFDLAADLRTRHTYRTPTTGEKTDTGLTRVYQLNGAWQRPGSRFRLSLGRQASSNFSSVSIFDGLLARYIHPTWAVGVFGGTQPDAVNFGFSTDIKELGVYGQWRTRPGSPVRLSLSSGLVGSYSSGMPSREYLFFRGQLTSRSFYGYASQEIDFNRDWKSEVEDKSLSFTSTYLNARYRIGRRVSLYGSFDNRRRVRTYRDRDTPESEFDDTYRQGYRGGIDTRVVRWFSIALGFANHTGETAGDSESYSLRFRALGPRPFYTELGTRHTKYSGPWAEGWLNSFALSRRFGSRLDTEIHVGFQNETRSLALGSDHEITWWGLNFDIALARGWYLLLSGERSDGTVEKNTQLYTSLSYRF